VALPAHVSWHPSLVSPVARQRLLRQCPITLWLTGLSGSGKSTLAQALESALVDRGHACAVLDGDNLRHGLNQDLGFSTDDRRENIRRVAEVASLMNDAGLIVIAALISPCHSHRTLAGSIIGPQRFVEVHVSTDLATCAQRDPKGLYAKALQGGIREFTGVSAPYEVPERPALSLDMGRLSVHAARDMTLAHIAHCLLPRA
jgi:adenylyl-sulfate kinase